jgi:transposase
MPPPMSVVPHLPVEEVELRYRATSDARESRHWQVILLMMRGFGVAKTASITTLSCPWVRTLVRRYNEEGPEGLGDRRRDNPGVVSPLTAEVIADLHEVMAKPPPDGGVWSGPKAAKWFSERIGQPVDAKKAWRWLREQGYVLRRPRPRHKKTSKEDQSGAFQGGDPARQGRRG